MATATVARSANCSVASTASTAAAVDAILRSAVDAIPSPAVDALPSPPVDSCASDSPVDSCANDSPMDTSPFVAIAANSGNVALAVPDIALIAGGPTGNRSRPPKPPLMVASAAPGHPLPYLNPKLGKHSGWQNFSA